MKTKVPVDDHIYSVKSTMFGIEWSYPNTTKEEAFARAQWFVREWANIGVEASARVFYRDGSPVADFKCSIHNGNITILNPVEV